MLPLVGTQFWIGIESFWNKVGEQLPEAVWEHYERYRRTLYILGLPTKSYEKHQGILKTVNRAIQEHRLLEIEYQVPGRPASMRAIEPYGVALFQSSIYVVSTEELRDGAGTDRLRHWKLDRFKAAKALDKWFKPNPAIDLQAHLGQSVGIFSGAEPTQYVIRLSEQAARWVEEDPWHPSQQIAPEDDGSVMLTVMAYHDTEIIQRVMRLGTEAEVISPKHCRDEIQRTVVELAKRYSK
ncbi:MAG: WYL domain-containing protein [Pirellulaceae bacterium]